VYLYILDAVVSVANMSASCSEAAVSTSPCWC